MQTVVLVKRSRSRRKNRLDAFFYCFYLPLNILLIYWPIPLVFPFTPSIKPKHLNRWQESSGPEMWMLFHLVLFALLALVVYWTARQCYRPSRFLWLPVILAIISLLVYSV